MTKFATMLVPVRDERQRDAGQRHEPEDAADDDERLQREAEAEPGGEQLREAVLRDQGDAHPARRARGREEHRGRADQPELLRDRRVDEVGLEVRDQPRPVDGVERPVADPVP